LEFVRKHITLLGILLYMMVTLGFVSGKMNDVLCENVHVVIVDSARQKFVQPQEVVSLLKTMEMKLWGYSVFQIESHQAERTVLNNMPMIAKAIAYADIKGNFHLDLEQRKPIARIVTKTGHSYYLGEDGHLLPLSPNYTARVPVVSGDIYQKLPGNRAITIDTLVLHQGASNTMLDETFRLLSYIYNDSLLRRMVEQVYVNKNEFEIIPKVGTHVIEFGDISQLEHKFIKLKVIYYKGFSNLGWNKYSRVNLKYKNQVVCTKR
jgi:cell division protein FtsQ